MSVVLRTSVSMAAAGQQQDMPLPSLHVDVAVDPSGATPDGDLRFAWHVTSTSAEADAGAPAEVARGWVAQVAPVEHLSGTGAVSAHGLTRGVTVDPGTAGDAGPDAEMVVQVVQMLRDVAVPLPVEPIGAGARWQKLSSLEARKGRATETDTFTLAEIAGDLGTVDDVVAQTATPQALPPLVGVPSASPARVDSVLMSGSARSRFDLGRLVPQTQLDATTSMGVSAPARDRMQMVLRLAIGIGGSVRSPTVTSNSCRSSSRCACARAGSPRSSAFDERRARRGMRRRRWTEWLPATRDAAVLGAFLFGWLYAGPALIVHFTKSRGLLRGIPLGLGGVVSLFAAYVGVATAVLSAIDWLGL